MVLWNDVFGQPCRFAAKVDVVLSSLGTCTLVLVSLCEVVLAKVRDKRTELWLQHCAIGKDLTIRSTFWNA